MFNIRILPKIRARARTQVENKQFNEGPNGEHTVSVRESNFPWELDKRKPQEISIELYQNQEMILRDYLAADRTAMSNEQSLLAFIRTALATAAAGAALIKLGTELFSQIGGWLLIAVSFVIMLVGAQRFRHMQKVLAVLKNTSTPKSTTTDSDVPSLDE